MESAEIENRQKKWDGLNILWVWTAIVFMITLFEPLSIYFTEKNEFWFDFYTMFPRCVGMFAVIWGVGAACLTAGYLILGRIPKAFVLVDGVLLGLLVACYVQGNFMSGDLPVIAGGAFNESAFRTQTVQSDILWCAGIVVFVGLAFFLDAKAMLGKVLRYVGCMACLFFMLTVFLLGIQNRGFSRNILMVSTTKGLWDYSSEKNFVIFVLDSVDGDMQERVLEDSPEFEECLKDFTDYTNVLSGYPYTQWALPFIMSGDWYEYDEDFNEYVGKSYTKTLFAERLQEEGYKLDLYTNETPFRYHGMDLYDNVTIESGRLKSDVGFCKLWLRLVGFKYAPYRLKRYSQIYPWEFDEIGEITSEYPMVLFYESNRRFFEDIHNPDVAKNVVGDKYFKLIHVEGAHLPMWYRADMSYQTGVTTTFYENVGACNTLLRDYIDALKEMGVYDNTVLVVMSDHGFNEEEGDTYYGRQHPILFVKGLNENHDKMIRNDAPVSHEDFGEMYQRLLDGAGSEAVFDYAEGDVRSRRYLWCTDSDATGLVESYTQGHARDTDALKETGIRYP